MIYILAFLGLVVSDRGIVVQSILIPEPVQVPSPDGSTVTAVTPAPLPLPPPTPAPYSINGPTLLPIVPDTVDISARPWIFKFCNPLSPNSDCAQLSK